MNKLSEKKCVPCEGGVPALDISEIHNIYFFLVVL